MNAITRPATPEELDAASDLIITRAELERVSASRQTERARQQRRRFWERTGCAVVIGGLLAANLSQWAFMWVRPPQTVPTPIFVYTRDDGTVTNYAAWDSLPASVRNESTVNVVWQYVMQRESWNPGNARYAWEVVSALSSPRLRDQFQTWYRRENAESPAARYKDGTAISVEYQQWDARCSTSSCPDGPDTYLIWFKRLETPPGGQPIDRGVWRSTVHIRRNVPIPTDRLWQRWTFNAPQIQVDDYAGPERQGVTR